MINRRTILFKEVTKVSIIIPVYNGEKYIKEAIDSALNQTYKDIEVIVVDDGSTDKTWWKLRHQFSDKGIITLTKQNGGTASALNMGIEFAQGDFIKWLSADDVLLPDAIENMMLHVNNDEDYSNKIYYTNYHVIDKDGKFLRNFVEPEVQPDLWKRFYGNGSTSLIHKSVFDKCGLFDESLKHSEDYEFWLRATQIHGIKLQLIPIFTINYRNHPDQLTNTVGGSLDKQIREKIKNELSQTVTV